MNGWSAAQRAYDRDVPEDNRTDDEIEADAAERVREQQQAQRRAELLRNPSTGLKFLAATEVN